MTIVDILRQWGLATAAILGLAGFAGCSGSPAPLALSPASDTPFAQALVPIGTGPTTVQSTLGLWSLDLDFIAGTGHLVPLAQRQAQNFPLGDTVIPDLTKLFTDPAGLCGDCLRIVGVGTDPVTLQPWFDIRVTHPITTGRPELSAFDLQLLFVHDNATDPLITLPELGKSVFPAHVANADGYTDQLTASLEAALGVNLRADLFPFVNVAVDDSAGNFAGGNVNGFAAVTNPGGHNVFAPGMSDTVRIQLDLSTLPQLQITLALSGSFFRAYTSRGDALYQKNNPVYFLPEGNRKEAWRVHIDAGSALLSGDTGSHATLDIAIRDWQNGLTPQGGSWNPATADPVTQPRDAIPTASDVASVVVEIPGITGGIVDLTALPSTGHGRTAAEPLLYTGVRVLNTAGATAGTYTGAVRVRDSRAPQTNASDGDVLFQDGATFHQLAALDTYQLVTVEVVDDFALVGQDFINAGARIRRTGTTLAADSAFFSNVGATIAYSAIRNGQAVYVSSGAGFSGAGKVQVYDLANGDLLMDYALPTAPNPVDLAFITDTEVFVTCFNSNEVHRINIDPAFAGSRTLAIINLNPIASPGFFARPWEIRRTAGGRYFVACSHLDGTFAAAPAGLLAELDAGSNTVSGSWATTGLRNTVSVIEHIGANRLVVTGPGTYGGDGGSGSFSLLTNTWSADPFPPGLAWGEAAATSTGRAFVIDAFLPTLAHIGLPFGGTINHQLPVLPPPGSPFPYISAVAVDPGDFLYATEFGEGVLRVYDARLASNSVAPTSVAVLSIGGGLDALGVRE